MKDEINLIIRHFIDVKEGRAFTNLSFKQTMILLDYITNLQEEKENQAHTIKTLLEENERLKKIARKMHLWIFLHSGNEQEVYDELELTDEENAMLGYSGQFRLQGEDKDE